MGGPLTGVPEAAEGSAASSAPAGLVVVLTGPTGTGKSRLALQVAERLAGRVGIEIVSVDSAQVYRGMDIGTDKPDVSVRARIAHHLIDIRDPKQGYSAGQFVRDARAAIAQIHARGHVPLLVGGTMMYLHALREGLAPLPAGSAELRRTLAERARCRGWAALHAQLEQVDPEAAAHIAPTDTQRIERALEVFLVTGIPISTWQRGTRTARAEFRWLRFALWPGDAAALRARLASRFARMLEAGLLEEVRSLYARADLSEQDPAVRAVGYRHLWAHLAGRCDLQQAVSQAVLATGQLARRQLTWMRRDPQLTGLPMSSPQLAEDVGRSEALAAAICAEAHA